MITFFNKDYDYATKLDVGKFISLDKERPSILTSYFIAKLRQIKNFSYYVITEDKGYSDFISFNNYEEDHSFWWMIKLYNNIIDEEELTEGRVIKIPSITDINEIYTNLRRDERLYENKDTEELELYK